MQFLDLPMIPNPIMVSYATVLYTYYSLAVPR